MKAITALIFLSVFLAYASATPLNDLALQNRLQLPLGDIVREILNCLLNNLSELSKEDLSFILQKLKEILEKIGVCLNIKLVEATEDDILSLIECLISKLAEVSPEQLADIVRQLQPVLNKVQNILNCIRDVLKKLCNGLCNIPNLNLCGSSVLGLDLVKIILQLVDPLMNVILCRVLG
ncbi:hypothetical protein FQR65_LT00952 [Abscondita terminalis]|nr:hypothetical protein FQR65_LT00952 [Abscondita terminalis]